MIFFETPLPRPPAPPTHPPPPGEKNKQKGLGRGGKVLGDKKGEGGGYRMELKERKGGVILFIL